MSELLTEDELQFVEYLANHHKIIYTDKKGQEHRAHFVAPIPNQHYVPHPKVKYLVAIRAAIGQIGNLQPMVLGVVVPDGLHEEETGDTLIGLVKIGEFEDKDGMNQVLIQEEISESVEFEASTYVPKLDVPEDGNMEVLKGSPKRRLKKGDIKNDGRYA